MDESGPDDTHGVGQRRGVGDPDRCVAHVEVGGALESECAAARARAHDHRLTGGEERPAGGTEGLRAERWPDGEDQLRVAKGALEVVPAVGDRREPLEIPFGADAAVRGDRLDLLREGVEIDEAHLVTV